MKCLFARLCAAVVLAAATSCSVVVDDRAGSDMTVCEPSTSVSLDAIDGGDVNTMYVKVTVTGPDGAVADGDVTFFLAKGGGPAESFLEAPATDAQGVTLLDLGGHVATDQEKREAVTDADTLIAEYVGRPATSDRTRLCPSSRSVTFSPDKRGYEPAATGVATPEQLVERLLAVGRVLESDRPYRMPDGQSPCRLLVALLDDLERNPAGFDPVAVRDALDRTEDTLRNCVVAPLLTSVQVAQIASVLNEEF